MSKYEIILDVCKTSSISKTAAKLNYSQSAVSQLIKSFEKELLHNAPFDICVRSFTEHYSRVLGAAYLPDTQPSPATLKFLSFAEEWAKKY